MIKYASLKYRLFLSYVALSILTCAVFITVFKLSEEFIEEELIYPNLNYELSRFVDNGADFLGTPPPGLSFYQEGNIPGVFDSLEPKKAMQEVVFSDKEVDAIVRLVDGKRYIVVDDHSVFEYIESIVLIVLLMGSFFSVIAAVLFSKLSINRVIKPLTLLSKEIEVDSERLEFSIQTDDEIGVLARAFEKHNAKVHQFLERERVFSSDVSHELRTPLMVILGASEVLSAKLSEQPKLLETINRIKKTATNMADQISALLLLSQSPEKISLTQIDMKSLLQEEIKQSIYFLDGKPVSITLDVEANAKVLGEQELIVIAFRNLIHNACRHTDKGSITVKLFEDRIIVEDTGSGIPPDIQPLLFVRHTQDPNNNSQTGYGFGLSITKRIVDFLGWNIEFQTSTSGGSCFTVTFALAPDSFVSG